MELQLQQFALVIALVDYRLPVTCVLWTGIIDLPPVSIDVHMRYRFRNICTRQSQYPVTVCKTLAYGFSRMLLYFATIRER